jgi:hypothetical protein
MAIANPAAYVNAGME